MAIKEKQYRKDVENVIGAVNPATKHPEHGDLQEIKEQVRPNLDSYRGKIADRMRKV